MATNGKSGDNRRHGEIRSRTQVKNTKTGLYVKKDYDYGRFIEVKTSGGKFKGVTDKSK